MKKTFFKTAVVLVVTLFSISCTKEGPAGATGANGTNGTNGINGNANVIGTNTLTISSWTSFSSGSLWSTVITATGITQSIVDKGLVSVFIGDSSGWTALPYTIGNASWFYSFGVGFVTIFKTNTTLATIPNPGSQTFRVVIISPSNRIANPNADWKDYNQVKKLLNLEN